MAAAEHTPVFGGLLSLATVLLAAKALWLIAAVAALLGICRPLAHLVALAAGVGLYRFLEGVGTSWSHGYNVVFLAQLPLVFLAPGRRWPLVAARVMVASMFGSAAFHKLHASGIGWAWSDNMRGILVVQYIAQGRELPSFLRFVVDNQWAFRGMALGNLVAQGGTFLLSFGGARARLAAAALFLAELAGLGLVMQLPNWNWAPLALLFIDLDHLWAVVRRRGVVMTPAGGPMSHHQLAGAGVLAALTACQLVVAFHPDRDFGYRLSSYPFTAFDMYSGLFVEKPLSQHKPVSFSAPLVEYDCARPGPELGRMGEELKRSLRERVMLHPVQGSERNALLLQTDQAIRARCDGAFGGVQIYVADYEVPAYPAGVTTQLVHKRLFGRTDRLGTL